MSMTPNYGGTPLGFYPVFRGGAEPSLLPCWPAHMVLQTTRCGTKLPFAAYHLKDRFWQQQTQCIFALTPSSYILSPSHLAGGIADDGGCRRYVAGDDAAGTDDRFVADRDTRQD